MPFEIVRNDITAMKVDAIVNTANPRPVIGAGTDSAIHAAAGPQLLEARRAIGLIGAGEAAITPGFYLDARYIIHTVGPVWQGGACGETAILRRCYDASLALALEYGCSSVAFPLISAGSYGFPKDQALQIAIGAFSKFLTEHEMQIYLVVFNREAFRLTEQLFRDVASYIDENYVQAKIREEYGSGYRLQSSRRDMEFRDAMAVSKVRPKPVFAAAPMKKASLADMLEETDEGFSEYLLRLIAKTGKKDSAIYKKANVSKQVFSKIRSNPFYQPTKATAIAFAIALELDLEQTQDLIGRAGFTLTNSSKSDVIIKYFIRERNYDMFDINAALFEFDQSLLGGFQ